MAEALCRAAEKGEIEEVRRLIDAGAEQAAKDSIKWTALHQAAWDGREGEIRMLLDAGAGADVSAKDGNGFSALHLAAHNGHEGAVRMVLDAGADMGAKQHPQGSTSLHMAAARGHKGTVRMLLGAGADMAAKAVDGKTALDLAEEHGHAGVARVLRDAGAAQAASAPAGVAEVPVAASSAHAGARAASIAGGGGGADESAEKALALAKLRKEEGNALYKTFSYATAAEAFSKAIFYTDMLKAPIPEEARALKITCLVHTLLVEPPVDVAAHRHWCRHLRGV